MCRKNAVKMEDASAMAQFEERGDEQSPWWRCKIFLRRCPSTVRRCCSTVDRGWCPGHGLLPYCARVLVPAVAGYCRIIPHDVPYM